MAGVSLIKDLYLLMALISSFITIHAYFNFYGNHKNHNGFYFSSPESVSQPPYSSWYILSSG